jgi:PKD repeat protein
VGSGSTYSGYVDYGTFQLQVNVTDAVGGTASTWIWVTGGEQMCGNYVC